MSEARTLTVGDVMTTEVTTLAPDEKLDLVEDVMHAGRIRHMPVVEGKRLVGIISARDVLAASLSDAQDYEPTHRRAFLRWVVAGDVMTRGPATAAPDTPLTEAAEVMCKRAIGCLPVVDEGGDLVGLLTATDLVRVAYLEDESMPAAAIDHARRGLRSLRTVLDDELDLLRRSRQELELQLHLGKADAKDRWRELEGQWQKLERIVGDVAEDAKQPLSEVQDAAESLVDELRSGYRRLRRALTS